MQPAIAERGGALVVLGPARPEHIAGFRAATGYDGALFVDPSLGSFREAGLAHGWAETFHPLAVVKGVRAFASGFRQGVAAGRSGTAGRHLRARTGDAVRFEWRDRHAGDHPDLRDVLAALDPPPDAVRALKTQDPASPHHSRTRSRVTGRVTRWGSGGWVRSSPSRLA